MSEAVTGYSNIKRLERAADILEIRDVLTRYCLGIDKCDVNLAASAYHEDATEDHGPFVGKSRDFLSMVIPILRSYETLVRHITNVAIEFDGDTALSEAYWIAILRDGTVDLSQSGRYLDRFERRKGEWRISARLAMVDWWRIDPRNAFPLPHNAEAILKWGKRGFEDPAVRAAIGAR